MKLKKYLEVKWKCSKGCVGTATQELLPDNKGYSSMELAKRAHSQGKHCFGTVIVISTNTYDRIE